MRRALVLLAFFAVAGCVSTLDKAERAKWAGDFPTAEALYERAAYDPKATKREKSEYATFLVERGEAVERKEPDRAAEYYGKALRAQPGFDPALTKWVRMLRELGRTSEAIEVLEQASAAGECASCKRLRLILLLEQGDQAMADQKWDEAIGYYAQAQAERRQAAPELAIALAHLQAGRSEQALEQLRGSVEFVDRDTAMSETFVSIRAQLLDVALAKEDLETVDEVRRIRLSDEPVEAQFQMAMKVADHIAAKGDRDAALQRYSEILESEREGTLALTAGQRTAVEAKMLVVFRARIERRLRDGEVEPADEALRQALELRPDDMDLRLQRLLALAPKLGAEPTLTGLQSLPADTKGLSDVRAALLSLQASEHLDRGDVTGAMALVERAKEASADFPEVHLAVAEVLAQQAPDYLSRNELRSLRRGMVAYGSQVRRYGEALAELDFARSALRAKGSGYVLFTPWFKTRAEALERRIREVYPYKVEYRADPEPLLVFENPGDASIALDLFGPEGFEDAYELVEKTSQDVTLPDAGLLKVVIDGETQYFFAEPYARVTIAL